jgi:autotransporter-associated beta strand protein
MKPSRNPFLRNLLSSASTLAFSLMLCGNANARMFDINDTASGFGVADAGSYDWLGTGLWNSLTDATGDDGTAATTTWTSGSSAFFVGAGAGTNYTVLLGTGASNTNIANLAINVKADGNAALSGAAGDVTIGNSGDAGILTLSSSNSVGAQGGGTLTINNGMNLNARTMNFRGGNVVINGVISGTGASKIAFGPGYGLTSGTLTLANTTNTYAGRANSDYIAAGYTLAVTKLGDGGQNSSIGTSSANIGINGGTLKFIGTGAQFTNLGIQGASGGAFIEAAGATSSDTISISGAFSTSAAGTGRALTLTGANVGNNTISSNLLTGIVSTVTKSGEGTWVLSGENTHNGLTKVTGGTLKLTNNLAIQNSVFDTSGAGTLDTSGVTTPTFAGLTGAGNLALGASVTGLTLSNTTGAAQTYSGNLTAGNSAMTLTKQGANSQTLSGSNSYSGLTKVTGNSILIIGSAGAIGSGAVQVDSGSRLSLRDGITLGSGRTMTISGDGAAGSTSSLAGALRSISANTNEWAGNVTVGAAFTRIGAELGTLKVSGVISGTNTGLFIRGNGTGTAVELSGANDYTGDTTIASGTGGVVTLSGGANRLPTSTKLVMGFTSVSSKLDLNGQNQEVAGISVGGNVGTTHEITSSTETPTLKVNAATASSYTGTITGSIALTKMGADTLTLSGANTYTGNTTVSAGTLSLGNGTVNTGLADAADVIIGTDPSAVLDLNFPSDIGSSDTVKTLTIGGVQKAAGVWGSTISGAANTDSRLTGLGTLNVTTGPSSSNAYDIWATTTHGLSGANADFDFDYENDGIKNGLEWILGGNPTTSSPGILPAPTRNLTGDLVLTFTRLEAAITESTLVVEYGTDLATWPKQVTIGATGSAPDVNGVTVGIDTAATPDAVTVTIPSSQAFGAKLFTRLKATKP